jgi:MFS transporter, OFA family, oxalate/formate antiporter
MKTRSELSTHWPVLAAAATASALGAASIPFNTLGAIILPLGSEFGWTRAEVQFGFLVFTLAAAIASPIAGVLVDRFGARPVGVLSLCGFAVAFAAFALTPSNLVIFYALWAMLAVLGIGSSPLTWTRIVVGWFTARRGLALAITLTVSGLAGAAIQVLSTLAVQSVGWRGMFLVLAAAPLLIAVPLALMFARNPPEPAEEKVSAHAGVSVRSAFGDRRLWLLILAVAAISFAVAGLVSNLKPLLSDRGYSDMSAAAATATVGLSIAAGRLVLGFLIDRFWAPGIAFPVVLLPAVGCLLLVNPEAPLLLAFVAAAMIGLAAGAETDLMAFLTTRYFGVANYGKLYGVLFAVFTLFAGAAPFLVGLMYDLTGSYTLALQIAATCFVIGAFAFLALGPYPDEVHV